MHGSADPSEMAARRVSLPYGDRPYPIEVPGPMSVLTLPALPAPPSVDALLSAALAAPFGAPLAAPPGARVTLIISDPTRPEPRAEMVAAIREWLPDVRLTIAVATGTHGPCRVEELALPPHLLAGATLVNHDGHASADIVELGTTSRGTPVRVHRCLVETDLVIATGCIRPHYFAGFGAGVKALFPGLGEARAIRINHRLKTDPHARAGVVDGNPCRDDIAEAAHAILAASRAASFLLNGVVGPDDRLHAAVAGALDAAFHAGVARARPWFTVRAPRASLVIASDALPVTGSLYQAAKIAAAAAPLVAPGGMLVVVAQCPDGVGPLETVNEAIFRIGVLPRLAPSVRLVLVSDLDEATTRQTLLDYAPSVEAILSRHACTSPGEPVLVIPHASHLIAEPSS